jgi:hypothetical protein
METPLFKTKLKIGHFFVPSTIGHYRIPLKIAFKACRWVGLLPQWRCHGRKELLKPWK